MFLCGFFRPHGHYYRHGMRWILDFDDELGSRSCSRRQASRPARRDGRRYGNGLGRLGSYYHRQSHGGITSFIEYYQFVERMLHYFLIPRRRPWKEWRNRILGREERWPMILIRTTTTPVATLTTPATRTPTMTMMRWSTAANRVTSSGTTRL